MPARRPAPLSIRLLCTLSLALAACHGGAAVEGDPLPPVRPLAALVTQQVVVAPTHSMRETDALGWTKQVPRSRELMRALDDALARELSERGIARQWIFPADLVRASKANPSYAQDPYALAAGPLRLPDVPVGSSVGSPLILQLRTMVALQENARAVLLPVELRFERVPASSHGVAVLRLALLDGRLGEVRWIGDVRSDPAATFSRDAILSSIAEHVADLITAR